MYLWRKLNRRQREELLDFRRFNDRPWHSPQHLESQNGRYLLTGACYEHRHIAGLNLKRLADFSDLLLKVLETDCEEIYAWSVLPNHYHALVLTRNLSQMLRNIGLLHGRTSFLWNGEDNKRGRKVWFNCTETAMKSDRHLGATLNYIHHNPVHHGYVRHWQEWPFSSVGSFLQHCGRGRAVTLWQEYPIHDYGRAWDPPEL